MNATVQQCKNLTVDLLQKKLNISDSEVKELLCDLMEENVVVPKYTFQCRKCGEMNTFTEDMINTHNVCQFCKKGIDVNFYKKGAMVRYILNQNNFWEYMDDEGIIINEKNDILNQDKNNVIPFEQSKEGIKSSQLKEKDSMPNGKKVQLFISHATKDLKYIKCFVDFLEALGFNEENMFCSSIDGYGIKWGKNIYDYLQGQFNNEENELIVLFMLSDNYYKSAACLNEMGAAWVLKKEYRSILLPGFEFGDLDGAIDPRQLAIKLDDNNLMMKLNDVKEQLVKWFDLKEISSNRWDRVRAKFIDDIEKCNNIKTDNRNNKVE